MKHFNHLKYFVHILDILCQFLISSFIDWEPHSLRTTLSSFCNISKSDLYYYNKFTWNYNIIVQLPLLIGSGKIWCHGIYSKLIKEKIKQWVRLQNSTYPQDLFPSSKGLGEGRWIMLWLLSIFLKKDTFPMGFGLFSMVFDLMSYQWYFCALSGCQISRWKTPKKMAELKHFSYL